MKNLTMLLVLTLISYNAITAQNVNIGIKGGSLYPSHSFQWTENVQDESYFKDFRPTFGIYGEAKIFHNIYLGAEVGVCSFNGFIDIKYRDSNTFSSGPNTSTVTYLGWYQQEQIYFSINPQYKFGKSKWLSVGFGLGIYNNYINQFHNGLRTTVYQTPTILPSSLELGNENLYLPNTVSGGHLNITFNPKLNKHLGLLIDARYIINGGSNGQISYVKPILSINSFAFTSGLSFHL